MRPRGLKNLTREQVQLLTQMRAEGFTMEEIGRKLGVTKQCVSYRIKREQAAGPRQKPGRKPPAFSREERAAIYSRMMERAIKAAETALNLHGMYRACHDLKLAKARSRVLHAQIMAENSGDAMIARIGDRGDLKIELLPGSEPSTAPEEGAAP